MNARIGLRDRKFFGAPFLYRLTIRLLLIVSTLTPLAACAQGEAEAVNVVHPRLFFGPDEIPEVRRRAATEPYRSFYHRYRQLREEGFHLPNPELDPEMMSRHIGALMVCVEGRQKDASRVREQFMDRIHSWNEEISGYDYEVSKHRPSLMISRRLQALCMDFDLLAGCDVFTRAEKARIREVLGMVAGRLMERGDSFNPYDYMSDRFRPDNWNSDRVAAVGMFALAFPEHPQADEWLKHAAEEVVWQLEHTLLPRGGWPEGTRYQGAVLRAFVPFATALRRNTEIDLFQHPRFKNLLETLAEVRTPPIDSVGQVSLSPGIGNANWESIWFAPLAWSAPAYKETDPELAGRLMYAWRQAGSPWVTEFSPGNPMAGFFLIDVSIPSRTHVLAGTCLPSGWAILRGPAMQGDWYLLFNVGTPRREHQHQHDDRGSFSLFAEGVPIAIDPGVRDYDQTMIDWYMRSKAHNQVVFADRDGSAGGHITGHLFSDDMDYVGADLGKSVGQAYERHLFYLKPDVLVVWDRIEGDEPGTYHLHVWSDEDPDRVASKRDDPSVSRFRIGCQKDIRLDWLIVSPPRALERELLEVTRDPHPTVLHVEKDFVPTLVKKIRPCWFQLRQSRPRQDMVTILHPRKAGQAAVQVVSCRRQTSESEDGSGEAIEMELDLGDRTVVLLLNSQESVHFTLEGRAACLNLGTKNSSESLLLVQSRVFRGRGWEVEGPEPATVLLGGPE